MVRIEVNSIEEVDSKCLENLKKINDDLFSNTIFSVGKCRKGNEKMKFELFVNKRR